jgi:hypothetical protein
VPVEVVELPPPVDVLALVVTVELPVLVEPWSTAEQRQLLLPVSDNYFCRFRPRPSARSTARFSAPSVR